VVEVCYQYRVSGTTANRGITFTYIDCDGIASEVTFGGGQVGYLVCAQENTVSITDGDGSVSSEGNCGDTPSDPVINCELSEWSAYSSCDGQITQTRTRTVITQPSNGGTACGALSETIDCPVVVQCFNIRVFSSETGRSITFTYIDCGGISREVTFGGGSAGYLVCAQDGSISITDGDGTLSYEGSCTN
jgi:hypothetical protein